LNTSKPLIDLRELLGFFNFTNIPTLVSPSGYYSHQWHSNGASAIASVLHNLAKQPKNKKHLRVLLPGYFCGQSLRYVRSLNIELVFYPLTKDLSPNFIALERLLIEEKIDALILVHYFGKVQGQSDSRDLADQYNTILIEDCAHVSNPNHSEWIGDFVIFSPHKHLPLPEIGLVFIKKFEDSGLRIIHSKKSIPIFWLIKQAIKMLINYPKAKVEWKLEWNSVREEFTDQEPNKSTILNCIRFFEESDSHQLSCKENVESLKNILSPIKDWEVLPSSEPEECSIYLLGMRCVSEEVAKRRMSLLNSDSQLVMQWPDLPEEIKDQQNIYEQAVRLTSTSLFFFVHHKINQDFYMQKIERVINNEEF